MHKNRFLADAKNPSRTIREKPIIGRKEDGSFYFNSTLLVAASYPTTPLLERANFAHIVCKNIMEVMSRDCGRASNRSNQTLFLYALRYLQEVNDCVRDMDFSQLKNRNTASFNGTRHSIISTGAEYTYLLEINRFPLITAVKSSDLKGIWLDGKSQIPINFFRDFSYEYQINNLDLWCMNYMNTTTDQMETKKLRLVLAWVNSELSESELQKIRSIMHKFGIIPIFVNIDLLNAVNYRRSDNETDLKYEKWNPEISKIDMLAQENLPIYVRVPYESFDKVIEFYHQAATDPRVRNIYIAFYRTVVDGRLVDTLIDATHNGKNLKVYTEQTARGDEYNNLQVVKRLQDECDPDHLQILCSFNGLKVHAKIGMVELNDGRLIVHMGTGNFNEATAKIYTDFHAFSENPADISQVVTAFQSLGSRIPTRQQIKEVLLSEIRLQSALGDAGRIALKCNHVIDEDLAYELRIAAQCGCSIKMCTRSSIGIPPGVVGVQSETDMGQFLEHERIYGFGQGDDLHVYLSSSDLMFRNLYKRMEVLFRITNQELAWEIMNELWFQ